VNFSDFHQKSHLFSTGARFLERKENRIDVNMTFLAILIYLLYLLLKKKFHEINN
jgi:hypothetical protein